jgi:sulfotransferase
MQQQIFFQSSLPRSGSTLLQNIIAQRPDFYASPTSGLLELIYAARKNFTESLEFKAQNKEEMETAFKSFCASGLSGYYKSLTEKQYVIDKSRGWGIHYDFLSEIQTDPKIVCVVRDLRDIFCSMEKKYRSSPLYHDPILNWNTGQGTTTAKRIDEWLAKPPLGLAIERLSEIIKRGFDRHILFIRYEDLTLYPQTTMTKIYNYLGVQDYKHDFEYVEQVTKEDDTVYGIYGDHTIRNKVMPLKSQADKVLGKEITKWIYDSFQWYFQRFGYEK